jgi:hypothetical protein
MHCMVKHTAAIMHNIRIPTAVYLSDQTDRPLNVPYSVHLTGCLWSVASDTEKCQLSPDKCQLSPDKCQLSPEKCQLSPDKCQLSPDKCQLSPDKCQLSPDKCQLSPEKCQLSPEKCQLSPEKCQLSPEKCQLSPEKCAHHGGGRATALGAVASAAPNSVLVKHAETDKALPVRWAAARQLLGFGLRHAVAFGDVRAHCLPGLIGAAI